MSKQKVSSGCIVIHFREFEVGGIYTDAYINESKDASDNIKALVEFYQKLLENAGEHLKEQAKKQKK